MSLRPRFDWQRLLLWHAYGCAFGVFLAVPLIRDSSHGPGYLESVVIVVLWFALLSPVLLGILAMWTTLAATWLRSLEQSHLMRVLGLVVVATGMPFLLWFSLIVWGGAVGEVSHVPDRVRYWGYLSVSLSWLLVPRLLVPRLRKSLLA